MEAVVERGEADSGVSLISSPDDLLKDNIAAQVFFTAGAGTCFGCVLPRPTPIDYRRPHVGRSGGKVGES